VVEEVDEVDEVVDPAVVDVAEFELGGAEEDEQAARRGTTTMRASRAPTRVPLCPEDCRYPATGSAP